jgi:hypothetical protein
MESRQVESIGADRDPVRRNLRITLAYHELSAALRARTGGGANWCTFATWASKQAGQTIRGEDLARAVGDPLGEAEALSAVVSRIREILTAVGRPARRERIVAAIREVFSPVPALERASRAVARGNKKVFDEIGLEFARFIPLLDPAAPAGDRTARIDRLRAGLRRGSPPRGQQLLAAAFADYERALAASEAQAKAEWLLLANLRIGLHEQTRLQPEITEALNAPIPDPGELKARLVERLLPAGRTLVSLRAQLDRRLGWTTPLEEACARLAERLARRVRAVVTEHLMTLALPEGALRLGSDVARRARLPRLVNPELAAFVRTVDPTPDSARESGATDWADLAERMHFITDLFRTRQGQASLFDSPFAPQQTEALAQGRMPAGRL